MQIKTLKSFVLVAELLHFARAAERLGIAQATLSQQIAALEHEVGVQLLRRDNRNVRLTPAGEAFLDEARATIDRIDGAIGRARQVARGEVGSLKVGAASAALLDLVPMVVERLAQRYPALEVQIAEHSSMVQESMLIAGEIDVGLLHPPLVAEGLRGETVMTEPMVLAIWDGHPLAAQANVALADLAGARMLLPERQAGPFLFDRLTQAFAAAGVPLEGECGPCAPQTVLSLVAAKRGLAIVPGALRHLTRPGVVYRPLVGQPLTLDLAAAWRAGEQRAAVLNFRRALLDCCEGQKLLSALMNS